jgi:hypothetical protein
MRRNCPEIGFTLPASSLLVPLFDRGIVLPDRKVTRAMFSENPFISMGFKLLLIWGIRWKWPDVVD